MADKCRSRAAHNGGRRRLVEVASVQQRQRIVIAEWIVASEKQPVRSGALGDDLDDQRIIGDRIEIKLPQVFAGFATDVAQARGMRGRLSADLHRAS